jgi:hypothetical protein
MGGLMEGKERRGSEKIRGAWENRGLTEEGIREIEENFEKSSGTVEQAHLVGGDTPTGLLLSVSYSEDDVPRCGNDLSFWLYWHRKYGGVVRRPKIIINGTPWPDVVRVQLGFGNVEVAGAGRVGRRA